MARTDVVVGVFSREGLSTGLIATHRAGFGPHARVLDGARGPLTAQLHKAGHRLAVPLGPEDADTMLILITAPGRAALAADTLAGAAARAVHQTVHADRQPPPAREPVPTAPVPIAGHDSSVADTP